MYNNFSNKSPQNNLCKITSQVNLFQINFSDISQINLRYTNFFQSKVSR